MSLDKIIATVLAITAWVLMVIGAAILSGCASARPVPTTCNISLDGKCLDCEPIPDMWQQPLSGATGFARNGP